MKKKVKNKNNNIKSENRVKFNKKNFAILLLLILSMVTISSYISNNEFRSLVNSKLLKKESKDDDLKQIQLKQNSLSNIMVSGKYIYILNSGIIKSYDNKANEIQTETLNISDVVSSKNDNHLVIAETKGKNLYVFENGKIKWHKKLDINISKVTINEKGFISVCGKSSIYNSVVILINIHGEEILKKYFSSSFCTFAEISKNNDMLVIGSLDYSKLIPNSEIEIIDINKAKQKPQGATIKKYNKDKIIVNLKIKGNNEILVQYADEIFVYDAKKEMKIYTVNEKTEFIDINIDRGFSVLEMMTSSLFDSKYALKIYGMDGTEKSLYLIENNLPKNLTANSKNNILEMGQELIFINKNGWLSKKHISKREINGIQFSNNVVAIIYTNRVDILEI